MTCLWRVTGKWRKTSPMMQPPHFCALFKKKKNHRLMFDVNVWILTLILLTWSIWWAPNNASKWQMGFNWAFKGLISILARRSRSCRIQTTFGRWTTWYISKSKYVTAIHDLSQLSIPCATYNWEATRGRQDSGSIRASRRTRSVGVLSGVNTSHWTVWRKLLQHSLWVHGQLLPPVNLQLSRCWVKTYGGSGGLTSFLLI
jgi:hypothetical protein